MDFKRPIPASQAVEVLLAVALILWRIWARPIAGLWADWVTLLALYWIFTVLSPEGRVRTTVTVGSMAALVLLYAWSQSPFLLALLRTAS